VIGATSAKYSVTPVRRTAVPGRTDEVIESVESGCADAQLFIFRVGKEVRRPLTLETSQHF
jgi:hypothetical protein